MIEKLSTRPWVSRRLDGTMDTSVLEVPIPTASVGDDPATGSTGPSATNRTFMGREARIDLCIGQQMVARTDAG